MPCGTLAVTDCSELENMAAIIKSINSKYSFDKSLRGTIQRLDGYTPVIFYDFADYITSLCNDPILLNQFREQLNHLVPYKPIQKFLHYGQRYYSYQYIFRYNNIRSE